MATYIIVTIIVVYSIYTLFKFSRRKLKGQCDDACSQCSASGTCPAMAMKLEDKDKNN